MAAILRALVEDIHAGIVRRITDAARVETFDDFLDHAAYYLNGRKVAQAGVIAGVVFEDTIRRACSVAGVTQKGVALEQLISRLASADRISSLEAKHARASAGT